MNIGSLIATMGVDTAGLAEARREMDRMEQQMGKRVTSINARMQTMGKTAQKVGRQMSMYLTLPIAAAGTAAFNLYKDFDSSMTKIVSLVGVAETTVDGWRRDLIKMAPELAKTPQELADAMFFVTSAGFRGAAALDVLEKSAKASAAGLGETKVVADLVTSAINAYGEANLNAGQATDILVAAVREGKAEAPALAASLGQVLPIASELKVSFDQVGAAVAAMTRTGTDAATASIQLRQILATILKPSHQAEQALTEMGTSAQELRDTLKQDGLIQALSDVKDLQEEYGEDTIGKIFPNIRALSGVLDIMGSNAESNISIFEALSEATGAADYAFQKVTETTEFKWNKALATAKTNLTVLGETVSAELVPILEDLGETIGNITDWFNSLDDAQRRNVIRIAAIVAAAGPLLSIFGFMATNIIPGLTRRFLAATKAFNVMKIAMMANPVGAIIAGITAIAGAYFILRDRMNEVSVTQQALNDVNSEATRSIAKQKSKVDQLYRIASSELATLEQRKAAIDELNRIVPQYNEELTIEKINTDKAKEAKTAYIQELLREAKVRAAQEKLQELEEQRLEQIVLEEAKHLSFFQKYIASQLYNYGLANKAVEYSADVAEENMKRTEESIDSAKTALEEYLDTIMQPGDISQNTPALPGGGNDSKGTAGGGGGVTGISEEIVNTMKDYENQLRVIASLNEIYGNSYDEASAAIDLHKKTIEELLANGLDPQSDRVLTLTTRLLALQAAQTELNSTQLQATSIAEGLARANQDIRDSLSGVDEEIAAFEQSFDQFLDQELKNIEIDFTLNEDQFLRASDYIEYQKQQLLQMYEAGKIGAIEYYNTINELEMARREQFVNTLEQFASYAGATFSNVSSMWAASKQREVAAAGDNQRKIDAINREYARKQKQLARAEAYVNIAVGVTKALARGGLLGIANAAAITAAGAIQIATINRQQMKDGGIVPPGYPNDTYPALLTSGEEVRPPIPLNRETGRGKEELIARISGSDLLFILREAEQANANY